MCVNILALSTCMNVVACVWKRDNGIYWKCLVPPSWYVYALSHLLMSSMDSYVAYSWPLNIGIVIVSIHHGYHAITKLNYIPIFSKHNKFDYKPCILMQFINYKKKILLQTWIVCIIMHHTRVDILIILWVAQWNNGLEW